MNGLDGVRASSDHLGRQVNQTPRRSSHVSRLASDVGAIASRVNSCYQQIRALLEDAVGPVPPMAKDTTLTGAIPSNLESAIRVLSDEVTSLEAIINQCFPDGR